ncbi:transposase [Streptomyces sp.]|uniref:transposase n=1 Tax=Streptomyces sp. TaxID=1931 RepID=UPI0035C76ABF
MDDGAVIRRHELSDAGWEFVRPLLPVSLRGCKRLDDRRVLNGIVWKFRTGVAWRDVPERYGPWATLHTRAACRRPACRWPGCRPPWRRPRPILCSAQTPRLALKGMASRVTAPKQLRPTCA